ncbi:hypothetical protein [Polaribacter sp. IC073]|uniref:hypothetical protein n=1 Tax=Polaribacter sp. IC073 TaxID=2508540 RepID=UPI0011BD9B8C|nr:hypothetical protein [Polaribacter sp. IC073]TXD46045.1 hypothetical protein ES045_15195 [Polaribacter sp. IC073]
MKISTMYPNFKPAVKFWLDGKNYSLVSDDSKKVSFMIPLASHKKGFDYYELDNVNGGVVFSLVTMLGFKTIKKSSSKIINDELPYDDWRYLIDEVMSPHLRSEEYQALKKGYAKTSTGCFGMLAVLFISFLLVIKNL